MVSLPVEMIKKIPQKRGIQAVRMIGVEPTWITPLDPKSSASANFATSAEPQKGSAKIRKASKW